MLERLGSLAHFSCFLIQPFFFCLVCGFVGLVLEIISGVLLRLISGVIAVLNGVSGSLSRCF